MINITIKTGRVATTPQVSGVKETRKITFNFAVYQGKEKDSIFYICEGWGEYLCNIGSQLVKGDEILVVGRDVFEQYVDKHGVQKSATKILLSSIERIGRLGFSEALYQSRIGYEVESDANSDTEKDTSDDIAAVREKPSEQPFWPERKQYIKRQYTRKKSEKKETEKPKDEFDGWNF